jgi:hypothetical protein
MTGQPPYGPPADWHRDEPRPTWADRGWWVPVALLGSWILSPVWTAALKAGGWPRALAVLSLLLVGFWFKNLLLRRLWFRRQEDR